MKLNDFEGQTITKMPNSRFEPATPFSEIEIGYIEKALGRRLPDDYCTFVKEYGGAFVGGLVDGQADLPILAFFSADENRSVLSKLRFHSDLRKKGVLPIADCEMGNLYVLTPEESVLFVNCYGGSTTVRKVADSFQDFIARIVVPEGSE